MRITTDTNVLVSAIFWNGNPNRIIECVERREIVLVLSRDILEELTRVLDYKDIKEKIVNKALEMSMTVEKIASISTIVQPHDKLYVVKDDPDDDKVLECAKAGNVDYIISSDAHLLKLEQFENIIILTPKEFVDLIHLS